MNYPQPTIQSVINNKKNEVKRELSCFKIGKIIAKNSDNTYNIELCNTFKKNDSILPANILQDVHPIKEGIKGKSLRIEYGIGEFVVIGFFDISYDNWFGGQLYVIEDFIDVRRHHLSDGFIMGRITQSENTTDSIALITWLQSLTNNLKEALQDIRAITAIDSASGNVTFININNLDNNIANITQSITDLSKVFE